MNIPIWLVLIAPPVFAMIGFFACAVLTAGRSMEELWEAEAESDEAERAHKRVTDALAAKNARIQTLTDIARSQQSIKSGRIIEVLGG